MEPQHPPVVSSRKLSGGPLRTAIFIAIGTGAAFVISGLLSRARRSDIEERAVASKTVDALPPILSVHEAIESLDGPRASDALSFLGIAAGNANPDAQLALGIFDRRNGHAADSLAMLKASAGSGNAFAQAVLGSEEIADRGIFPKTLLPKDPADGMRLLQLSAQQGCAVGAFVLGEHLRTTAPEDAARWYKTAAQRIDYFTEDFDPFAPVSGNPKTIPDDTSKLCAISQSIRRTVTDAAASKIVGAILNGMRETVLKSQKRLGDFDASKGNFREALLWYQIAENETGIRQGLPIAADRLLAEYESNELRADSVFKGRLVAVSGFVSSVGKDILGHPYVVLVSAITPVRSVQCMLRDDAVQRAAQLNVGDTVTLTGNVDGLMMNVLIEDCSF